MAYKDKDKQREANRQAMRRYRQAEQRRKGITNKVSQGSITDHNTDGDSVTLEEGSTQGITARTVIETRKEIELRTPLTNKPERTERGKE